MMPEIRFRDSEERLIKEMEAMRHSIGCQWRDRCDTCKGWGQGFYEERQIYVSQLHRQEEMAGDGRSSGTVLTFAARRVN
jgi:hypothetical protein